MQGNSGESESRKSRYPVSLREPRSWRGRVWRVSYPPTTHIIDHKKVPEAATDRAAPPLPVRCSDFTNMCIKKGMSSGVGLATEFHSEKILRNRLRMVSFIPWKKVFIPRHSEFYGRVNSEARNGRTKDEKNYFYKNSCSRKHNVFRPRQLRNGIPRVYFYFCSTERNSELFSLPRNGLEQNYESCFYFCIMAQNSEHFSPLRNGSERNSESFLFRGTARVPPEQTNCSAYSVFRGIIPKDTY
jgi:hypothetical protein